MATDNVSGALDILKEKTELSSLLIGERIKRIRELQGISQASLAESVGITQPSVADIEKGRTKKPQNPVLISIAKILDNSFGEKWLEEILENEKKSFLNVSIDDLLERKIETIVQRTVEKEMDRRGIIPKEMRVEKINEKERIAVPPHHNKNNSVDN